MIMFVRYLAYVYSYLYRCSLVPGLDYLCYSHQCYNSAGVHPRDGHGHSFLGRPHCSQYLCTGMVCTGDIYPGSVSQVHKLDYYCVMFRLKVVEIARAFGCDE